MYIPPICCSGHLRTNEGTLTFKELKKKLCIVLGLSCSFVFRELSALETFRIDQGHEFDFLNGTNRFVTGVRKVLCRVKVRRQLLVLLQELLKILYSKVVAIVGKS